MSDVKFSRLNPKFVTLINKQSGKREREMESFVEAEVVLPSTLLLPSLPPEN